MFKRTIWFFLAAVLISSACVWVSVCVKAPSVWIFLIFNLSFRLKSETNFSLIVFNQLTFSFLSLLTCLSVVFILISSFSSEPFWPLEAAGRHVAVALVEAVAALRFATDLLRFHLHLRNKDLKSIWLCESPAEQQRRPAVVPGPSGWEEQVPTWLTFKGCFCLWCIRASPAAGVPALLLRSHARSRYWSDAWRLR